MKKRNKNSLRTKVAAVLVGILLISALSGSVLTSAADNSGWQLWNGAWYYIDPANGMAARGWISVYGGRYFLNENGAMQTGWLWQGGSWYYLGANGRMQTGWVYDNGYWYYFEPSGAMHTGWLWNNGYWYFFDSNGAMHTGWLWNGGYCYYFEASGVMHTGWAQIGGLWYYFDDPGGFMAVNWCNLYNRWYYFAPEGYLPLGWVYSYGWFYQDINGLSYTGLAPWGENYFYVKKGIYDPSFNGKAAVPGLSGEYNVVNGFLSGGLIPPSEAVSQRARAILDSVNWDLYAAYRYCVVPWVVSSVDPNLGTAYFADLGFNQRTGNCYVMAAMFTALARECGYEAYQMAGYVGASPHSWVEIRNPKDGQFYVCDPDLESEHGTNAYFFSYGTPGTWRYSSYYRMHN